MARYVEASLNDRPTSVALPVQEVDVTPGAAEVWNPLEDFCAEVGAAMQEILYDRVIKFSPRT